MAVDEVLLAQAAETGACYWRIYRWEEPTLSLGYFQDVADRQAHAASRGCTLVRRPSGGGAIVHDREITYSVALPGTHALGKHRQRLYHEIHSTVVALLAHRGLEASLSSGQSVDAARQPFLCFQRRAPGDVLVRTVKVAGSAQRRVREAVLQHGSLLVGRLRPPRNWRGLVTSPREIGTKTGSFGTGWTRSPDVWDSPGKWASWRMTSDGVRGH